MFNYLKISLLALLSMGSLLAMELPEPQIKSTEEKFAQIVPVGHLCFKDDTRTIIVPKKDIEKAATLADFVEEYKAEDSYKDTLDMPSEYLTALITIKDYLSYDNEAHGEVLRKKLNYKNNEKLTAIINAANVLHAQNILSVAVELLAQRLNHPGMQEKYLTLMKKSPEGAFYNLSLNTNTANLVAQEMDRQDPIISKVLLCDQIKKHGAVPCTLSRNPSSRPAGRLSRECRSPDGTIVASAFFDGVTHSGSISLWDANTGNQIKLLESPTLGRVIALCFSPDGAMVISGSTDGTVRLWDANAQTPSNKTEIGILRHSDVEQHCRAVCCSPDGKTIASGSLDEEIRLWSVATQEQIGFFPHSSEILSLRFSPDGTMLAAVSIQEEVFLWDIQTKQRIPLLERGVASVSFSHDGKKFACGTGVGPLYLQDIATKEITVLHGHLHAVRSVCFSRDNAMIISASWDGDVRIWDVKTGKTIRILRCDRGGVHSVSLSQDGIELSSLSTSLTCRLWHIADKVFAKECKSRLTPEKITAMRFGYTQYLASWQTRLHNRFDYLRATTSAPEIALMTVGLIGGAWMLSHWYHGGELPTANIIRLMSTRSISTLLGITKK